MFIFSLRKNIFVCKKKWSALLLRTKVKHCFWNEILFIRNIKSFNGDGNFIFILYFSTSPASWCFSSFFFFFFFFLLFWCADLVVFTSRVIWKEVPYYFSYCLCGSHQSSRLWGEALHLGEYIFLDPRMHKNVSVRMGDQATAGCRPAATKSFLSRQTIRSSGHCTSTN